MGGQAASAGRHGIRSVPTDSRPLVGRPVTQTPASGTRINFSRGDRRLSVSPDVSDRELLDAVQKHEPAATSEVADEVDMSRQGVDKRLRSLREKGKVESKKIAASLVWHNVNMN